MNIAWIYLDKRNATINALKDYESMNFLLKNAQAEVAAQQDNMTSLGSPVLSDMPKGASNPHAVENRVVKTLDMINILNERYQRAVEYMRWFQPAWQVLTEDEQFVLSRFYLDDDSRQADSVAEVCERYHIERTSAYKKKDRALSHLTLLLYGK